MLNSIEAVPCPYCERESLVGALITRMDRVDLRFDSYKIEGYLCSCPQSKSIDLAHVHIDESGDKEIIYEYREAEFSNSPVWDEIYNRS
jgi:hypothetical protein